MLNKDCIISDENSIYQHGKASDRIYIMKLSNLKSNFIKHLEKIALINDYSKIIGKIPFRLSEPFKEADYKIEASIPGFYNGNETCAFMSKYFSKERQNNYNSEIIDQVIQTAQSKAEKTITLKRPKFIIQELDLSHLDAMARLYKKVFKSYPFPIFDPSYLEETMLDHVIYYGVFKDNALIACASCETDKEFKNAELTDFAVLLEYRGQDLASLLLIEMEKKMKELKFKTVYTLARSFSYGMNCTFGKNNYHLGGTLYNNTQISGSIESMNIWYKLLV